MGRYIAVGHGREHSAAGRITGHVQSCHDVKKAVVIPRVSRNILVYYLSRQRAGCIGSSYISKAPAILSLYIYIYITNFLSGSITLARHMASLFSLDLHHLVTSILLYSPLYKVFTAALSQPPRRKDVP